MFYRNNFQRVGRSGELGFLAEVGVRQGCPLSPLIFAVIADVLLRSLHNRMAENIRVLRAFADDTALILQHRDHLDEVFGIFRDYAVFSNLHLNLNNAVCIPLAYEGTIEQARSAILQDFPLAALMAIAESDLYLGILLGPGAGEQ